MRIQSMHSIATPTNLSHQSFQPKSICQSSPTNSFAATVEVSDRLENKVDSRKKAQVTQMANRIQQKTGGKGEKSINGKVILTFNKIVGEYGLTWFLAKKSNKSNIVHVNGKHFKTYGKSVDDLINAEKEIIGYINGHQGKF